MNCERCQIELDDFLYGELSEARASEARAHLSSCSVCAAVRDAVERENEIFARFYDQTSIEPAPEMWEAIRSRINADPQPAPLNNVSWLDRLRAAAFGRLFEPAALRQLAFAALLVALSVAATTIYLKRGENGKNDVGNIPTNQTPTPIPTVIATPTPSPSTEVAVKPNLVAPKTSVPVINHPATPRQLTDQELMNRQIARAEHEYLKAIKLMDQAIAKQRDRLDPELIKQYESNLALLDNSIGASRRALRDRPDDPIAGQFLLAAYAKKLDLMQDIAMK